jgi:glutamine---fructose-6-phosphate transaminase (isomerizing)
MAAAQRLDFESMTMAQAQRIIAADATQMYAEAQQASDVVAQQYARNESLLQRLADQLRDLRPSLIFTCARGSSDHAATYAKYLFETRLRIPTISQAPSISSIYGGALLHMRGEPFFLISQSGRSPDLLMSAEAAKRAGALVIALVNDEASPLAALADIVVPLCAGPEKSVAATKSYLCTLAALARLTAFWAADADLLAATDTLPADLDAAWNADWSSAVALYTHAKSVFVLGRGLTFGIAQEAALKFKETSGIHAEAFSIAEVAHGPMALVGPDKAAAGLDAIIGQFSARGAKIAVAGSGYDGCVTLPMAPGLHPVTGPIAMAQRFYKMVNAVSVIRGFDPDHPPSLQKVTETQ